MSLNYWARLWQRLFLEERPSLGLAFFRIAAALTTGFHVIPTFFPLRENYLSGAFRELNSQFFTMNALELVQKSPDSLVIFFVWLFCLSWFFFLVGFWTQFSGIIMTLCCYYFYALNSFVIGTLSWDILLVTLFLLCLTPYPGDYFSIDSLRQKGGGGYHRLRPFFIQRLLQVQIAFTYFYTGLYKITAEGNWLKDNPVFYLMSYPAEGVTKYFLIRDWMAVHPGFCYVAGVLIVVTELAMPFLLFNPSTRLTGIYLGFFFHILLILTLDVPAIFFFLFPAQLLLFIDPKNVSNWIEDKRLFYSRAPAIKVVYDGDCRFCTATVSGLKTMDLYARLTFVNYHASADVTVIHPALTKEKVHSELHFVDFNGKLYSGFYAFRRMTLLLPMLYPMVLVVYFPGANILGPLIYRVIAENRYIFHFNKKCANNACFR